MIDYRTPKQTRSKKTFDALLCAAGELLSEVGIETISTNLICAKAGVTPPAFYRYFDDKYSLLAALSDRLMEAQNVVLEDWLDKYKDQGIESLASNLTELLKGTTRVTAEQPGALWIMRALRCVPSLTHIRIESHNYVTELLTDIYHVYLPHVPRELLRRRTRMSVEMSYAITELLEEEDIDADAVLEDSALVFNAMFNYPEYNVLLDGD